MDLSVFESTFFESSKLFSKDKERIERIELSSVKFQEHIEKRVALGIPWESSQVKELELEEAKYERLNHMQGVYDWLPLLDDGLGMAHLWHGENLFGSQRPGFGGNQTPLSCENGKSQSLCESDR